ncbi:MAG: aldehyde dehydrogenase family protein [Spirochaetaceae bacterium]
MSLIEQLFNNQKEYFLSGETLDLSFRKSALKKLKESIIKHELDIVEALKKDLKKPLMEVYTAEIMNLIQEIKFMTKNLKKWTKPINVRGNFLDFPSKSQIIKEPFGSTLIIGTWNYPFELTFKPLIGALASGNVVIIKPSEHSPNCSRVINNIIKDAFDDNYVTVLEGDLDVVLELQDQAFDKIFFTGSTEVGKKVMEKASKHLTNVTLELGGKNPCIVDRDTNINVAVKRIIFGKFMNNGQTCIAPDYIIIHESLKDEFIKQAKQTINNFWSDDVKQCPDYGRIINEKQFNRLIKYLNVFPVLVGGDHDLDNLYIEPSLIEVTDLNSNIMVEEIFGPILPIVTFNNIDDLLDITKRDTNPLALYIFSNSNSFINTVINNVHSGGVCINDVISQILNHNLPFGGRGSSGIGSYHGKFSIKAFSHERSILKRSIKIDHSLKYPPYNNSHEMIKKYALK